MNSLSTQKAFTLIELLIVIAIIGVLATLVGVRLVGPQRSARDARRQSEIREYQNGLEIYANRNSLYPVRTSTANLASLCATLGLTNCPDDPKLGAGGVSYKYQSDSSGAKYVLWATLEKTTDVFVACSDGQVGAKALAGFSVSGGNCPL